MPVSINSLGLQFKLAGASRTTNIPVVVNVYRRREEILFRSRTNDESVNISYFAGKELTSADAMFISDRSTSLVSNRINSSLPIIDIENASQYSIITDKFLVTDVYVDEANTIERVALFKQHVLSVTNLPRQASGALASGYKLLEVELTDEFYNPVNAVDIKIDWDTGVIYNNLEAEFNSTTRAYKVYFIRYSVKHNTDVTTYVELLSNSPVYRIAETEDLDSDLQIINDGSKVYLLEETDDAFGVTLPVAGSYSFKIQEDARVRLLYPPLSDISDSWHVSITNGKFFTNLNEIVYKYSVAEFINQSWDPSYPYKYVNGAESSVLSDRLIKLRHPNIHEDSDEDLYVDLVIDEADGTAVTAFTTNPAKDGALSPNLKPFIYWNRVDKVGIRSIDHATGIVDIEGFTVETDYEISSYYYYEEVNYEVTLADFNPIKNATAPTRTISFFLDPDTTITSKSQTLYYLVSDKSGKIIQSNWSSFDNDSQKLTTGEILYYENLPDFVASGGTTLFVPNYSVEGDGTYLILGDVFVAEGSSIEDATIMDMRARGGGLVEDQVPAALAANPEAGWFWDVGYWDGTPYPGNASYYIEVPVEVLEVAGGTFKTNQVRDVIDRHTAAGVYAVARTYGIDPVISGVVPGSGIIDISWRSYGE